MKTTCIINNYNYGKFVVEAVNSALNQSVSFDEIIVVDDASTDESVQLLQENFAGNERVKILVKTQNEGQLSCFNEGFPTSSGDIIFFLDADDQYYPQYLEEALKFYRLNPECDFLFCGYENIGTKDGVELKYNYDRNLGFSILSTLYMKQWVGSKSSTLSMRRSILSKILPVPYLEDWVRRGDDCLVWGASLAGGRKYFLAKPFIRYRRHDTNNHVRFKQLRQTVGYRYQRQLTIRRLFQVLLEKMNYDWNLPAMSALEFQTIMRPSFQEFWLYTTMITSFECVSASKKLSMLLAVTKHFLTQSLGVKAH